MHEGRVIVGRDQSAGGLLSDPRMSRKHAEVGHDSTGFSVRDLGSSNGTFVGGQAVGKQFTTQASRIMRTGSSLFCLCDDVRPLQSAGIQVINGAVMGPQLIAAWQAIDRFARAGSNLFLHGESGVGKEHAARAFHALSPRSASPFVAVNCGAIPKDMAERLFFGTKRGAYSGATADALGYVQAANSGTLFLDEVAELDLATQIKLLRVVETKEVLPLGATRPQHIDFQICSATHKDLRQEVIQGAFRRDLYFRIGRPQVVLPPLRQRVEEIPWLIHHVLGTAQDDGETCEVHVSFVETCMMRYWPGNVRELLTEVRAALFEASSQSRKRLSKTHLSPQAGMDFTPEESGEEIPSTASSTPNCTVIEAALRKNAGNISATARFLGIHRTQLRRWITRYKLNPDDFS